MENSSSSSSSKLSVLPKPLQSLPQAKSVADLKAENRIIWNKIKEIQQKLHHVPKKLEKLNSTPANDITQRAALEAEIEVLTNRDAPKLNTEILPLAVARASEIVKGEILCTYEGLKMVQQKLDEEEIYLKNEIQYMEHNVINKYKMVAAMLEAKKSVFNRKPMKENDTDSMEIDNSSSLEKNRNQLQEERDFCQNAMRVITESIAGYSANNVAKPKTEFRWSYLKDHAVEKFQSVSDDVKKRPAVSGIGPLQKKKCLNNLLPSDCDSDDYIPVINAKEFQTLLQDLISQFVSCPNSPYISLKASEKKYPESLVNWLLKNGIIEAHRDVPDFIKIVDFAS